MMRHTYKPGDPVVLRIMQQGPHPEPHARAVRPTPYGETYRYDVELCGVVAEKLAQDMLIVRTRRGITHTISADDPHLRHATWWERLWHRNWFPR